MNTPLSSVSIETLVDIILECSQNQNDTSKLISEINDNLKQWINSFIIEGEILEEDVEALKDGIHDKLQIMSIWNDIILKRQFFNNLRVYLGDENYFYKLVESTYHEAE